MSYIHTKYSYLTDEEFLCLFEQQGRDSPLMREAVKRLQAESAKRQVAVKCPICEASLKVHHHKLEKTR